MLEPRGALSGRRLVAEVAGFLLLVVLAFGSPPENEPDPRLPIVIGVAVGIGVTLARRRATRKVVDIAHLFLGGWAGAVAVSAVAQALLAAPRGESIERGIGYGVGLGFVLGLWLSGGLALIAYGLTKTGSTIVRSSAPPQSDAQPADLSANAGEPVSAAGTRAPEDQSARSFWPSETLSEQPNLGKVGQISLSIARWLGRSWWQLVLVAVASVGLWLFRSELARRADVARREEMRVTELDRQQRLVAAAERRQARREYIARRRGECYDIYVKERQRFSNAEGPEYREDTDTCRIRYKSQRRRASCASILSAGPPSDMDTSPLADRRWERWNDCETNTFTVDF